MDRSSAVFLVASLVASLGLGWVAFPYAALDASVVEQANTPQPAEMLDTVDVGNGFGELPVVELMDYYIENPPVVATGPVAAEPEIKFGGC